jgi:myosin-crossreactive antigen
MPIMPIMRAHRIDDNIDTKKLLIHINRLTNKNILGTINTLREEATVELMTHHVVIVDSVTFLQQSTLPHIKPR